MIALTLKIIYRIFIIQCYKCDFEKIKNLGYLIKVVAIFWLPHAHLDRNGLHAFKSLIYKDFILKNQLAKTPLKIF